MNISILLATALAMVFGLIFNRIAKKLGLPNVTGYLVAGLLIGPSLWRLIPGSFDGFISSENLSGLGMISTVALGFIAFSIGGEFRWSHLKKLGTSAVVITFTQAFGAILLVDAVLLVCAHFNLFGITTPIALTLGAISAATAPAATLMVVRQYKAKGPVTEMLLPVVALDDAVALIAFAVSFAISRSLAAGEAMTVQVMLVEPLIEIFGSLLLGAVLGFLLTFFFRFFRSRQNKLMLMLTVVLLGTALAEALGLSSLLLCMATGAFMANFCNEEEKMMGLLDAWTPVVFMLFFVVSGAQLELEAIPKVGMMGILYILLRSLGKYFGAAIGASAVKANPNVRKYLGITLLPQAGVAIGMATIVASTEGFGEHAAMVQAVVLCATLVYELIGPLLTKAALTKAGEIEKNTK